MSSGFALFLAVLLTVPALLALHFWLLRFRRSHGTPLLRVSSGLTLGTRLAFSVPKRAREVDFFLSYRRKSGGAEDIILRVHGPVSREFKLRMRGVAWAEYREVLLGVVPGDYQVELVGSSPAELLELLVVCHPPVPPR
jgi:hypothetical protein